MGVQGRETTVGRCKNDERYAVVETKDYTSYEPAVERLLRWLDCESTIFGLD